MASNILGQIRKSIEQLNPSDVRQAAERPVTVRVSAETEGQYRALEEYFAPEEVSESKRAEARRALRRPGAGGEGPEPEVHVAWAGTGVPEGAFVFDPRDPDRVIREILLAREELGLPLARVLPPFRREVTAKAVFTVAKENALFSLMTAIPDILPGISLPWAIPEAASDTAVLTVNQIRMAFLLAAASDRPVGYAEQKAEIGGIIAGAFGFRAIARELVGHIPMGGGLIPKAGIAFAGTFVEGLSLERLYRVGYGYSRSERKAAYGEALERGKEIAVGLWERIREARERRRG